MSTQCLGWLILLTMCNLLVYLRVVKLYEKVEHLSFLVAVNDHRLDRLEEERRGNEEKS